MPTRSHRSRSVQARSRARSLMRRGFTLTEVLIAIAIVVVLAGIVAVNVVGTRRSSKVDVAKIELNSLQDAIQLFEIAFDRVPSEDEGVSVLWSKEALMVEDETLETKWRSFIEKPKPNDPWGNEWGYRAESEFGQAYDLWSNGPDGEEGTDDDITSWAGSDLEGAGGEFGGSMPMPSPPPSGG